MATTAPLPSHRLQSIDILRGLAALAVLLLHIPHPSPHRLGQYDLSFWLWLPIDLGHLGVALFVVLSGFCIHTNTLRSSTSGELKPRWGTFWKRRFYRLYPPYALVVFLSAILTFVLFQQQGVNTDLAMRCIRKDVFVHLGMIHNLMPIYASGLYNGPLWTLGMEEQLYLLYAVLLLLRRWSLRGTVAITFGISIVFWQAWQMWGPATLGSGREHLGGWAWWPFQFWLLWTLGTVAAELHAGRIRLPAWCSSHRAALLLLTLGLVQHKVVCPALFGQANLGIALASWLGLTGTLAEVAQWLGQVFAFGTLHTAFFVIVNACIRRERLHGPSRNLAWRGFAAIGLFSYSLYLLHVPVIECSKHFWPVQSVLLRYLVLVPTCLFTGWCFFHLVEKHFLLRPRRKEQASISPMGESSRNAA